MQVNYGFKISVIHFHDSPVGFIFDTVEGIYMRANKRGRQVKNISEICVSHCLIYLLILRWCTSKKFPNL